MATDPLTEADWFVHWLRTKPEKCTDCDLNVFSAQHLCLNGLDCPRAIALNLYQEWSGQLKGGSDVN